MFMVLSDSPVASPQKKDIRPIERSLEKVKSIESDPFYKTTMCNFMMNCHHKDKCRFAHSVAEKRPFYTSANLKPIDFIWRTKMCGNGDICIKEDCGFAHSTEELRKIPCKFQSFCKKIGECPNAHYFMEPDMILSADQLINDSLASFGRKSFSNIEMSLVETDEKIQNIQFKTKQIFQDLDVLIGKYDKDIQELEDIKGEYMAMESEIEEEIQDIDRMIMELNAPIIPKKRKSWADDSDDEEDVPPKKWKSWADDSDDEEDVPPKKRKSWADDSDDEEEIVSQNPKIGVKSWGELAQVLKESAPPVNIPCVKPPVYKTIPKTEAQIKAGDKFRTKMCKYGKNCNRKKECGYAHHENQLRK
jgi:hypothetical protein